MRFSLIRLPFARRQNEEFVVCPFVDEETNGIYPFANGLNGLAHIAAIPPSCFFLLGGRATYLPFSHYTQTVDAYGCG
jgi:hypothetical protein